jgi:hypothetical protein
VQQLDDTSTVCRRVDVPDAAVLEGRPGFAQSYLKPCPDFWIDQGAVAIEREPI